MISRYCFILLCLIISLANNASAETPPVKFRIGLILSLSGSWADFGQAQENAIRLAQKDQPELFNNIEFIVEDCKYQPALAVAAFRKLVNQDQVDAVFVWGVEPALAVAPIAESQKIALFVSALDPSTAGGKEFVIRTINPASDHSARIAKYLDQNKFKRVGIVISEGSFFQVLFQRLQAQLPKQIKLEVEANHMPTDVDFRTTISRLKNKKYDAIGVYLDPQQVPVFFRQAKGQDLVGPFFGTTTFLSRETIDQAAGAMKGAICAHNYVESKFQQNYKKEFGTDDHIPWAANAYDFANLIGSEFGKLTERLNSQQIIEKVLTISKRKGVGGEYQMTVLPNDRYFQYPVVLYQITEDDFKVIDDQVD